MHFEKTFKLVVSCLWRCYFISPRFHLILRNCCPPLGVIPMMGAQEWIHRYMCQWAILVVLLTLLSIAVTVGDTFLCQGVDGTMALVFVVAIDVASSLWYLCLQPYGDVHRPGKVRGLVSS